MVLVITHKEDFTADYIVTGLQKKGVAYLRLNTEDLLEPDSFEFQAGSTNATSVLGRASFQSILFRRTKSPSFEEPDPHRLAYYHQQHRALLNNLWQTMVGRWVSFPDSVYRAENKLLQLNTAKALSMMIPDTLVSATPRVIKNFFTLHNGNIIVKPLAGSRIIQSNHNFGIYTNCVSTEQIENLEAYLPLPAIYQSRVRKQYELRVTVVGDKVFAARINSQNDADTSTDWRRGDGHFIAAEIPLSVKQSCLALTKRLGLSYGAIDFAVDEEGNYVFFEINPVGQFVWIELETGLPITNSLIDLLNHNG